VRRFESYTRRDSGFTYLTVLFAVAFMGLGLAMTGEVWRTAAMREKEAELLYVGNQYRLAIERYYKRGAMQYPRALEDLLKDPRDPGTRRYLRKHYFDPITGQDDWGVVKAPDGGIMGVYSRSEDKPFKTAGFSVENKLFEQAATYSSWKFVYTPVVNALPVPSQLPPSSSDATQSLPEAARRPIGAASPAIPPSPSVAPSASDAGARPPQSDGPFSPRHE
jgi:type II secretory pathway pseudopilin PulG